MKHVLTLILSLLILTAGVNIFAQGRRITPVVPTEPMAAPRPDKKAPEKTDSLANFVEREDADGNIILVDTVTGEEWVDSTRFKVPGYVYPKIHNLTVGLDVWDPVMRIFNQKYGLASLWASLSIYNRFFPYFELGMSLTEDTPSGMNYTYHSPLAPYFKIGANYNFLYNNNDAYQMLAGIHYGFTSFKYQVQNVTTADTYWGETQGVDFPRLSSTAGYLELCLGVKVRIKGPWSLGWMAKYHTILHETAQPMGLPMVIPGYGKRSGAITGSFSIMYTLPLNKKPPEKVITEETN